MSKVLIHIGEKRSLTVKQLAFLLDCVYSFEVCKDDGTQYSNSIADLIPVINISPNYILLQDENITLKPYHNGMVDVVVSEEFDGYEITGQNFSLCLYE